MASYSPERKEAILSKLLPPESRSVSEVALEDGISTKTLYAWLKAARSDGNIVSDNQSNNHLRSANMKFTAVVETASLTEAEFSQYCRERGLYPENLNAWKQDCLQGCQSAAAKKKADITEDKALKTEIKQLKQELRRKDKALAETAALLVLRKKLNALWETEEEDD